MKWNYKWSLPCCKNYI